ncbi:MAG: hypothetical protein LBU65_17420 [Planctomycetaceae bacterium]|nr:hypothetical protein [Planctomycetaceae bacterium]
MIVHYVDRACRTDLAMKILNQKDKPGYGSRFERRVTTLWEDWDDSASRNHIMFGVSRHSPKLRTRPLFLLLTVLITCSKFTHLFFRCLALLAK